LIRVAARCFSLKKGLERLRVRRADRKLLCAKISTTGRACTNFACFDKHNSCQIFFIDYQRIIGNIFPMCRQTRLFTWLLGLSYCLSVHFVVAVKRQRNAALHERGARSWLWNKLEAMARVQEVEFRGKNLVYRCARTQSRHCSNKPLSRAAMAERCQSGSAQKSSSLKPHMCPPASFRIKQPAA
jgi:hypothetical protein